jgi:hypothetical protein
MIISFFFNFDRGVPSMLRRYWAFWQPSSRGRSAAGIAHREVSQATLRWAPLYFAGLGIGFMMVEVAVIQQTRLFLGHPTLAVTSVLATLLVGGGVGSWLSGRYAVLTPARCSVGVVVALLVWMLAWLPLSQSLLTAALPCACCLS